MSLRLILHGQAVELPVGPVLTYTGDMPSEGFMFSLELRRLDENTLEFSNLKLAKKVGDGVTIDIPLPVATKENTRLTI